MIQLEISKERFISIRNRLKLTQHELADVLGVNTRTIIRYENGQTDIVGPAALSMLAIADFFKNVGYPHGLGDPLVKDALFRWLYEIR